jgi:hypothetical protein
MDPVNNPNPVATTFIRVPVAGPEPYNTLAFVRCKASGVDISLSPAANTTIRFQSRFKSKFVIDGFQQARHTWYEDNTQISAAAFIQILNQTDDNAFIYAVESVDAFIDLDGAIGFELGIAIFQSGPGLAGSQVLALLSVTVSAYVLLYEPVALLPPAGNFVKRSAAPADSVELGRNTNRVVPSEDIRVRFDLRSVIPRQASDHKYGSKPEGGCNISLKEPPCPVQTKP